MGHSIAQFVGRSLDTCDFLGNALPLPLPVLASGGPMRAYGAGEGALRPPTGLRITAVQRHRVPAAPQGHAALSTRQVAWVTGAAQRIRLLSSALTWDLVLHCLGFSALRKRPLYE